jgi:hypothetical protein
VPPKPNTYEDFDEEEDVDREARRASGELEEENEEDAEELRMRRAQMRARRDLEEQQESQRAASSKRPKANLADEPKVENPYESDETSYLIPILVAIGAFIPLLFCLCKL